MLTCPDCNGAVYENEDGVDVVRDCPLHLEGCFHVETAVRSGCRACRWEMTEWTCACYYCRVGETGCKVLARHAEERR